MTLRRYSSYCSTCMRLLVSSLVQYHDGMSQNDVFTQSNFTEWKSNKTCQCKKSGVFVRILGDVGYIRTLMFKSFIFPKRCNDPSSEVIRIARQRSKLESWVLNNTVSSIQDRIVSELNRLDKHRIKVAIVACNYERRWRSSWIQKSEKRVASLQGMIRDIPLKVACLDLSPVKYVGTRTIKDLSPGSIGQATKVGTHWCTFYFEGTKYKVAKSDLSPLRPDAD